MGAFGPGGPRCIGCGRSLCPGKQSRVFLRRCCRHGGGPARCSPRISRRRPAGKPNSTTRRCWPRPAPVAAGRRAQTEVVTAAPPCRSAGPIGAYNLPPTNVKQLASQSWIVVQTLAIRRAHLRRDQCGHGGCRCGGGRDRPGIAGKGTRRVDREIPPVHRADREPGALNAWVARPSRRQQTPSHPSISTREPQS
jgi:hypothetical protein